MLGLLTLSLLGGRNRSSPSLYWVYLPFLALVVEIDRLFPVLSLLTLSRLGGRDRSEPFSVLGLLTFLPAPGWVSNGELACLISLDLFPCLLTLARGLLSLPHGINYQPLGASQPVTGFSQLSFADTDSLL